MQNNPVPSITAPARNAPTSIGRSLSFRMIRAFAVEWRPPNRPVRLSAASNEKGVKRRIRKTRDHTKFSIWTVRSSSMVLRPLVPSSPSSCCFRRSRRSGRSGRRRSWGWVGVCPDYLHTITCNGAGAWLCPASTQIAPQIFSPASSACTQDINPLPYPLTAMNCCA